MSKLIDLSLPLEHGQLNFSWDPKISVVAHNTVASIGYNITQVSLSSHQGTHLDAPFHFYDDARRWTKCGSTNSTARPRWWTSRPVATSKPKPR